MKEVSVSILSKEDKFKNIEFLNNSNCDYIHLDIMDGNFVSNKFISLSELKKVLDKITKKIDVHLMVKNPEKYIKIMALYNISYITIHYEIKDYLKYIDLIKDLGFKVGISIKPETNIEEIYPLLDDINLVLIMGVNPGASGQKFIDTTEDKINSLKEEIKRRGLTTKISVDGGICEEVLDKVSSADILVSASYVLNDINNISILKGTN